jgi:two-component system NtrC family sensor kinase
VRSSLRTKLMISFIAVIAASGLLTVWVGAHLIGDEIMRMAQDKVRIDLNSAREVYEQRADRLRETVRLTALRFFLKEGLETGDFRSLEAELKRIREAEALDVLTLTDKDGIVVFRARNPAVRGDSEADDDVVGRCLVTGQVVGATQIVSRAEMLKESAAMAERARIEIVPTPMARDEAKQEETSGMMLKAAAPVLDEDGRPLGSLYGGKLLNQDYEIVDAVKAIVYQGEEYKGKDIGTATIFQGDLRVSTNVVGPDGGRAIGTRVSREVYDRVIVEGRPWLGRAFVVSDWYITAYEPIRDVDGDVIGMLYVGMLEAPYVTMKNRIIVTFSCIAIATIAALSVIVYFTTSNIIRPLKKLLHATEKIARGYLDYRVKVTSDDELGQLATSFNSMTEELQRTTDDYQALTHGLEEKVKERARQLEAAQDQLVQSEKMTSLGKMAAGIAHEINNPLTSILINSHLIAEAGPDRPDVHDNLKLIIDETTRCSEIVKGLLEFSRQTPPEKKRADVNQLIDETLLLMKSHLIASKSKIVTDPGENLPTALVDANKIKQVFANLILNALEAMPGGGLLTIRTRASEDLGEITIQFEDNGCGIGQEMMSKIFDPFFSTKAAKGTGLGLSVSYGIVEQHSGKIDVQSELGKGTTVTVTLPVAAPVKR